MRALAILILALGAACSGGRSLLLVEVSLAEPGLKPSTVEVTATPSGGSPVSRTFEWSNARGDVLSAGIFLPADVEGAVMVRVAGMDAGGALEATGAVEVQKGKATAPVTLALRRVGSPPPDGSTPPPDSGGPGPDAGPPDAPPPTSDLAAPADLVAPAVDVAPVDPPSLTRCQVYEHAGPCTITPTTTGVGVWDVRFSPDGKYLVSGGDDGKARIWKVTADGLVDENRVLDSGARSSAVHAAFSPDSKRMALGSGTGTIAVYEFPGLLMAGQLTGHADTIKDLAFSADGTRLVSLDWTNNVKLWDVAAAKELKGFVLPGEYDSAGLSPAGQPGSLWLAVSFSSRPAFLLADLAADPVAMVIVDAPMKQYGLAFSPDGRALAVSSEDGSMSLWDVSNKQKPVMGPVLWPAASHLTTNAAFSPDGRFVVGAGSLGQYTAGELKLAAVQPPGLRAFNATMSSNMAVDFSPDGRAVAAGAWRCGKVTYCKD